MSNSSHSQQERERRLLLASRSPRRSDLLKRLGFHPVVQPAEVEEQRLPAEDAREYTRRLSLAKAQAVVELVAKQRTSDDHLDWVLSADTVVVLDDDVLEKPSGPTEAKEMLRRLSDRWHTVVTSFTICSLLDAKRHTTRTVAVEVRFKQLAEEEIERYVASGEPLDKAGAYGVQNLGSFMVREVRGSYFAVVGLPVCEVIETLLGVGAISGFPFPAGEDFM